MIREIINKFSSGAVTHCDWDFGTRFRCKFNRNDGQLPYIQMKKQRSPMREFVT